MGDPHSAADLVQDTYRVALERPPRRPGPLRGWLATVARSLARNARRGERRRVAREERAARPERLEAEQLALEKLEIQRILFDLVLGLPVEQRTVLYLRYYEDLTPGAIAERLDVPVKTVKTRHTRAVIALRERLDARSRGERREWMSVLLPRVGPRGFPPSEGALAGLIGGLAMKKLLVAVALLLAAWTVWQGVRRTAAEPEQTVARERVEDAPLSGADEGVEAPEFASVEVLAAGEARRAAGPAPAPLATTGELLVKVSWSDGAPAIGLGLDASCAGDPAPREEPFTSRTDEQGRARFEALFAGGVRLDLHSGGRFETEVQAGATREFSITVPRGFDVEGRVVDLAGEPVSGAEIWCEGGYSSWTRARILTTTTPDGSFRLRDLELEASFGARARGHRPSVCFQPWGLPVGPDGARVVTLELNGPGGSVEGRVLDPAGRPLAGAQVYAGPRGGYLVDLPDGLQALSARPVPVMTGPDGSFVLPGDLEPGGHPIFAVAHGFPVREEEVEVLAGRTTRIELRLEQPATIEGRVVSRTGEPVADVRVVAAREQRGGYTFHDHPPCEARTDEAGRFVLGWLASGEHELNASVPDRPRLGKARAIVECAAGATSACELVLDPGLSITGSVVDAAGRPLAGWSVRGHTDARKASHRPRTDVTDLEGRFVLANLAEGPCLIVVGAPGTDIIPARAVLEDVLPGEEVEIVVEDAGVGKGAVRGRVAGADGTPPQDVQLVLFPEADRRSGSSVALDLETGEFRSEALPGRYVVAVLRGGSTVARSEPFALVENGQVDVGVLAIETPGILEVTLSGLPASALSHLHFSLDRVQGTTESLELVEGVLRAGQLAPGAWIVRVSENELFLRGSEVEIVAGETTRVELAAERGFPVVLHVSNASPRRVLVDARDVGGERLVRCELRVDEQGRATLPLPAGPAAIAVLTDSGLQGQVEVDVGPALRGVPPIEVELR